MTLLETIPDLILRVSREGVYLDIITSRTMKIYNAEIFKIGKTLFEVLPPAHAKQRMGYIERALATRQIQTYEYPMWVKDELHYEEARIIPHGPDQVVIIVRDITEETQLKQRQQLLNQVIGQIHHSLDLDTILQTSLQGILRILKVDRVLVCQHKPQEGFSVVAEVCVEYLPSILELLQVGGCCAEMPSTSLQWQEHRVADLETEPDGSYCKTFWSQLGVRAYVTVPIQKETGFWGTLIVQQCQENRAWLDHEIQLLESLAQQLSIAIQHAEIYRHVEEQVNQRTFELNRSLEFRSLIQTITDKLRRTLDESQILKAIVDELGMALDTYCCDVGIYDEQLSTATIQYEFNREVTAAVGHSISIPNSPDIYTQLIRGNTLQCCFPGQQQQWPGWWNIRQHTQGRPMEILVCPIQDENGVIGDLWLFRRVEHPFESAEIELVHQVADQCAIALRQSRLYQMAHQQIQELQQLNQLKDEFISTVSHELRTPLTSLRMALQLITTAPSEEKRQQYLKIATQQCDHEIELVNDLLSLQRMASGQVERYDQTFDPTEMINQLKPAFEEIARSQSQDLRIFTPDAPLILHSDPKFLARILRELLHNACKYTPNGGQIRLELVGLEDRIELRVANTGQIQPEELPRIFDKFYRTPQASKSHRDGTGLGLALVKSLVEILGGTIHVSCNVGWVQFQISIPGVFPEEDIAVEHLQPLTLDLLDTEIQGSEGELW